MLRPSGPAGTRAPLVRPFDRIERLETNLDRAGQPLDARGDLVGGGEAVGEANAACGCGELGARDRGDPVGAPEDLAGVGARRQLQPDEVAALGLEPRRSREVLLER